MNTIIFDTETTGLPTNWSAAVDDLSAWPRIVELAWIVIDENDNEVSSNEFIVKPNNFVIPKRVSDFHEITTEKALLEGKNINLVLDAFENDIKASSRLENFDISDWDMQIAVGLTGAFNCIKVFGNAMANSSRNCVILNIASDLSVIAPDNH